MFGMSQWASGGKFITVTEGELDALAVAEMFDGKWPVVSIKRGAAAAAKDIKENLEWLETFDKVVICFDNDEKGIAAAKESGMLIDLNQPRKLLDPVQPDRSELEQSEMEG